MGTQTSNLQEEIAIAETSQIDKQVRAITEFNIDMYNIVATEVI